MKSGKKQIPEDYDRFVRWALWLAASSIKNNSKSLSSHPSPKNLPEAHQLLNNVYKEIGSVIQKSDLYSLWVSQGRPWPEEL